jgi:uncharacterized membrane protein
VKWLSTSFAPMQIAFFRAFCAMALCLPVVLADSGIAGLRTRHPGAYVLRGLVGCGSIATSFYGVTLVPIADWVAITFMVPLFVAAMSAPMLGEKVGWRRWAAILVGFAGVLIIVPPTGSASLWALAVGITAQMLVSLALVLIRRMSDTERTTTIVFYYMLALVVVTAADRALRLAAARGRPVAAADPGRGGRRQRASADHRRLSAGTGERDRALRLHRHRVGDADRLVLLARETGREPVPGRAPGDRVRPLRRHQRDAAARRAGVRLTSPR